MNEFRQTLEDAFSAAPPDSDTRELIGKALDMLDTIPMEPLEIMAKVERMKEQMKRRIVFLRSAREEVFGEEVMLDILREEFPDGKE